MTFYPTYVPDPFVKENKFIKQTAEQRELPEFDEVKALLPQPEWGNHDHTIACYWKAWELAFKNLRQPTPANGFVANYIDTAFNDHLFMWDSAFILLFGRYGRRAFDFQHTLDNLYAKQHPDGYICREIREDDGGDTFERFDPSSTGPNVMPWTEWEYYQNFGDKERLAQVFPVLAAYHHWFRSYRTWPDGTYWASGWSCGMDNQPRLQDITTQAVKQLPKSIEGEAVDLTAFFNLSQMFYHGHQAWVDTCLQQILSARLLIKMAGELGRQEDGVELQKEIDDLSRTVNQFLWDEKTSFYYDRRRDGQLSEVKSIGAYWALLADVVPPDQLAGFVAHLENPREFNRPHRIPTLSADHPEYVDRGGYWLGAVWAPTNYMTLKGLSQAGYDALAHLIGLNSLTNVVTVFNETGTLWENYAPEIMSAGLPARPDFVGWSGLFPITILFEYVFGLRPDIPHARIVWDVRLLEKHAIRQYPFGKDGLLDLECQARSSAQERPVIKVTSNIPVTLEVRWDGKIEEIRL